ncbi:MAG: peptidoglycan-binding protein [Thermoleophilia bacterium]|nr:peptidoglycan-binding protein [Thermoleophilia bacterium]
MVVWAQEHLIAAGQEVPVTGIFGKVTRAAVRAFQEEKGMPVDGQIGTDTWRALLAYVPYRVRWSAARARASASGRAAPARRPLSASLPAKGYEISPGSAP